MKKTLEIGFSFGLTSGIITTLGLMVGLHAGTHSKLAVLGGILTIAIADAFSDSLGMHICEESENRKTKEIWESTLSTFLSKFFFALTFIVPVLLFNDFTQAIIISVLWGLLMISVLSFRVAKKQKETPWKVIIEHLVIALTVIIITHYVGDWISVTFG